MHSFLSKEDAFRDFPEFLQSLALTSSGYEDLNMLSSRTHTHIVDTWACELNKPTFSDSKNLDDFCIAMQECISLERLHNKKHKHDKQARMRLANLDDPIF